MRLPAAIKVTATVVEGGLKPNFPPGSKPNMPDGTYFLEIVAVFCPHEPGGYQIRHKDWGVFQGILQDTAASKNGLRNTQCVWTVTSNVASMLTAYFYTRQDAQEIVERFNTDSNLHGTGWQHEITVEPFDHALELQMWERAQPEILRGEAVSSWSYSE